MTSVKGASPRRSRARKPDVVRAAIAIVDQEGLEALTIRRVAQACGLSPMGVYRHVRDKDDLLDQVVNAVVDPAVESLEVSGPWDEQVSGLFRYARRLFLQHPGVAVLCVLRPTPVLGVARFYDRVLKALAEGGITDADAVRSFDTLLMFMFGSVLWEVPRTAAIRERLVAVALDDERTTHVVARAAELGRRDPAEYFEAGLKTIIDGIRAARSDDA